MAESEAETLAWIERDLARTRGPRFRLEAFSDIAIGEGPEWLIADIVPAAGLTVVFGESGCGKSFLVGDSGLAIARGLPWAGKEVLAGTVVYVTAEGASGFRKRLVAYRQHYDIGDVPVPFHVIAAAPDLGQKPGDAQTLIADIGAQATNVRAVVIDTLARAMNGADENSARDMGIFADNCAAIGQRLGCAVLALHHTGKDTGKGARGSSALRAAADCEILVEGSQERRTASVSKQKDGEDGWQLAFRLNRVDISKPRTGRLQAASSKRLATGQSRTASRRPSAIFRRNSVWQSTCCPTWRLTESRCRRLGACPITFAASRWTYGAQS
jgi:hypothetical protein